MIVTIVIFFIAIIAAFGMLMFRAWQIRTMRIPIPENIENRVPDLTFRHIEKSMLYLTKHIIQWIVLGVAKWWFITVTKTRKWVSEKWPKLHDRFTKRPEENKETTSPSFVQRAILESKAKIKRIKEKVRREHA